MRAMSQMEMLRSPRSTELMWVGWGSVASAAPWCAERLNDVVDIAERVTLATAIGVIEVAISSAQPGSCR